MSTRIELVKIVILVIAPEERKQLARGETRGLHHPQNREPRQGRYQVNMLCYHPCWGLFILQLVSRGSASLHPALKAIAPNGALLVL